MNNFTDSRKNVIVTTIAVATIIAIMYTLAAKPCPPRGICKPNQFQFNYNNKAYCLPCP